jgi:hypothetical protein
MFCREHPVLIADANGVLVGLACPPIPDKALNKELISELEKLELVGKKEIDNKRGDFEILKHGIQMGAGSEVRMPFYWMNHLNVCLGSRTTSRSRFSCG